MEYVYIHSWFTLLYVVVGKNQHNIVKQLSYDFFFPFKDGSLKEKCCIEWIHHMVFFHSLVAGDLVCLHFLDILNKASINFVSVRLLSCVWLFDTPWTAARQASLFINNSWSLLKLMSIELVMLSNHLILCHPLLSPSVFPSVSVFPSESALCIRWLKS